MELDINIVLNMALEKIAELERELIYSKAVNQQLLQKIDELTNLLKKEETEENNE